MIAVHRGTGGGLVTENTADSTVAAVLSGADIVEFDVVRSLDGDYFVFHDGYEFKRFGTKKNIRTMTTAQIEELRYRLHGDDTAPETVATIEELINSVPDHVFFNVDRSWTYWDDLLDYLDQFNMTDRLILKCPPEREWLEYLSQHHTKYPLIPMVRTESDVELTGNYNDVNTVGFELLAADASHPFTQKTYIEELRELGYLSFVNAINLENRKPLYAGWDDNNSLAGDFDNGWGKLVDLSVDIIQTDWPALLNYYLGRKLPFPQYQPDSADI